MGELVGELISDFWKAGSAIAVSVAGIALAFEYDRIAQEALEMASEIADRIFAIEKDLTDHWVTTMYPHNMSVLEEIYAYVPPAPDYDEAVQLGVTYGSDLLEKVSAGMNVTQDRYRFCTDSECNTELGIYAAAAEVDFAQHLMRFGERREERQSNIHVEHAVRTYRATREAPDDMFSLLRNAQNIYANIYNAASQSVEGAIGLVGYGIGTFIGGFFND